MIANIFVNVNGTVVVVIALYLYNQCPITTKLATSLPAHDEVYSIQLYVIKFVRDLRQVTDFLRVFLFSPTIRLTATI